MKYLIFESLYGGHYGEYIRHLLKYASNNLLEDEIHVVISNKYEKQLVKNFSTSKNIFFHFLSDESLQLLHHKGITARILTSLRECKLLHKYAKALHIDRIVLLTVSKYIFGLNLFSDHTANISGIEYIIPIRNEEKKTILKKLAYRFKMTIYAHTKQIKRIFLLNDEKSAEYYNRKYKTKKFKFLPDPIDRIVEDKKVNEIKKNHNDKNKIILLHAGRFRREKGTFEIIKALNMLTSNERSNIKFILCGSSPLPIDNETAVKEMDKLKEIMDVEFYNKYVDEEFLHSLYIRADYILIPYQNYYQSSGNLGHAASYNIPVIGPGKGLLGELIERYNLGYTLSEVDAKNIAKTIRQILNGKHKNYNFNHYVDRCNPTKFAAICFDKEKA